MFDALDEHDDGEVGREELLASLDLDHPHLMALIKASPAVSLETGVLASRDGGKGMVSSRSRGAAIGYNYCGRKRRGVARSQGSATSSVFDAIEVNDDEFVTWKEVQKC